MDSGCTFHMTPRRELLFNFKQIEGGKVLMGNDQLAALLVHDQLGSSYGKVLIESLIM